jgi:hypothetical protein
LAQDQNPNPNAQQTQPPGFSIGGIILVRKIASLLKVWDLMNAAIAWHWQPGVRLAA